MVPGPEPLVDPVYTTGDRGAAHELRREETLELAPGGRRVVDW